MNSTAEAARITFYTIADLRAMTGYSEPIVLSWIHHTDEEKRLPAFRLAGGSKILVRREDFEAWLERNRLTGKCRGRQTQHGRKR